MLAELFFSFGTVLAGIILLLAGSVSFVPAKPAPPQVKFPLSLDRAAAGGDVTIESLPLSRPTVPLQKDNSVYLNNLTAAAAVVVDDQSDTILFSKNIPTVRPLASITKLMSALVLLDLPMDWTTTTVIAAADWDGSTHHINVGEEFTLQDLWQVALIGSSNSAVKALVRVSGLTTEEFVRRMNSKVVALNFPSLRFVEPTGLESANAANVLDTVKLLKEALRQEKIFSTLRIGEYYAKPLLADKTRRVWSTNWLLTNWIPNNFIPEHIVGKTGYTSDSGYNFTVRLTDATNHSLRIAILGALTNESRFSEARDLADWVFGHYLWPDQEGYDKLVE